MTQSATPFYLLATPSRARAVVDTESGAAPTETVMCLLSYLGTSSLSRSQTLTHHTQLVAI